MTVILANPLRLEIQKRLTDALKEITIANGYRVEIGQNVFRGRLFYGDESPVPMLSILEVPIPLDQIPTPPNATVSSGQWELILQGWTKDDKANPTDAAHVLMADVKRRLALEKKKALGEFNDDGIFGLGRGVTGMYIGAGVVRPPDEVSSKAYFWLTITLDLAEDLEEPYEI